MLKFIYSEKATKFYEIFILLLTTVHTVKSKVKISQNFVAFSEYMNFMYKFLNKDQMLVKTKILTKNITYLIDLRVYYVTSMYFKMRGKVQALNS